MKSKVRLLSLVVSVTLILLVIGAVLGAVIRIDGNSHRSFREYRLGQ